MGKSKLNYLFKSIVLLMVAISLSVMLVACGEKTEKDMEKTLEKTTENFLSYNGSYEISVTQSKNAVLTEEKSSSAVTTSTYNANTGEMTTVIERDNKITSKTSVMKINEQFYSLTETHSYDETTGELKNTQYVAYLVGEDYAKNANAFASLITSGELEMIIGDLDTSMLAEYYDITCDKFSETKNGYKYEVELTDKSGRFNELRGVYTSRASSKTNLLTKFNDKLITKIKYGNSVVANVFGGKGTGVLDGEYSTDSYTTFEFNNKYNADLAIKDTTNYDLENAQKIGIYVTYYGYSTIKHIETKYGENVDLLKNFDSQLKSGSQSDGKWYVDEKCTTEFASETWPSLFINFIHKSYT